MDSFLRRQSRWRAELDELRTILLGSGLREGLKWGVPCYALDGKNVALIHGFKEYCAILFVKGALLRDPKGILIQQTRNVQAGRQIRFTSVEEVTRIEKTLKAYVREAIEIERAGLKVPLKETEDYELPEEFESKLAANAKLKAAFAALTPGRQRAYIFHFAQPKLSKTRAARVEKHIPRILEGLGLND
ncbi:MAG: YdeI/OmpD-associated family protein [Polyangiaceae bacterium]|nr:YdeI/OmpD-associated family protein [Polyangiaceae bacterium]